MNNTRRRFLALAGLAPVAVLASRQGFAQAGPACYDPNALPADQKNLRRALEYVEPGADPAKRCGTCAFFTATKTGCGACQMLSGGPVSATAYCSSFAPKPT